MSSIRKKFFLKYWRGKIVLVSSLIALFLASNVLALDQSRPNNKVGIHLAVPDNHDIEKAAELVNSNGGKWGYVTLVLQENDMSKGKWQDVFNQLRKHKLIPIIRVATQPEGAVWKKPNENDVDKYVNFLNSLNWVTKERYVVLFNEVNHGSEWGGATNPEDYAKIALKFARKLKETNKDYFVMLSGLDASAPAQPPQFEDEASYLVRIFQTAPQLKDYIDGLSSHSYPNPGFAGSPDDSGRGTVRTYEWELSFLRSIGVDKELPVFITETGWSRSAVSEESAAAFIKRAFENIWLQDNRVRAVTPFVLNYQGEPFTQFSYRKFQSDDFFQQFQTTKEISKVKGEPEKVEKGKIIYDFPSELLVDSNYHFRFKLKNDGQGYWDKNDDYFLRLEGDQFTNHFFSEINGIEPGREGEVDLFFKTEGTEGGKNFRLSLYQNNRKILEGQKQKVSILPLPDLKLKVNLFPKMKDKASDFEIQIFDDKEEIVYKKNGVEIDKGEGYINGVRNVYLGRKFRVVILKPYYLPRQKHIVFSKNLNEIKFERLLPLDFNIDGHFDLKDLWTLILKPKHLQLLLP